MIKTIINSDCGGKICLNGGSLNTNDCTCTCLDLYKGDICDQCE